MVEELFSENQQPKQTSQPSQHFQQQAPDFKVLYSELESHFRKIADIDKQPDIIRLQLYNVKMEIIEAVKRNNCKTHAEARKIAFDHAPSQILEFFAKKAGETAAEEMRDPNKKQQARRAAEEYSKI